MSEATRTAHFLSSPIIPCFSLPPSPHSNKGPAFIPKVTPTCCDLHRFGLALPCLLTGESGRKDATDTHIEELGSDGKRAGLEAWWRHPWSSAHSLHTLKSGTWVWLFICRRVSTVKSISLDIGEGEGSGKLWAAYCLLLFWAEGHVLINMFVSLGEGPCLFFIMKTFWTCGYAIVPNPVVSLSSSWCHSPHIPPFLSFQMFMMNLHA